MKTKFSILIFFLILISAAEAAILKVNTRDFTSEPTMRRRTTLTLIEQGPVVQGPWLIAGDSVARFTDTNGIAWYSNVLAGAYRLDVAGTPGRSFPITVSDTNGIVDAAALVNSTNANTSFYTAAQVDAKIAAAPGGSGGVDTNTVIVIAQDQLRAGSNVVNASQVNVGGTVTLSNQSIVFRDAGGNIGTTFNPINGGLGIVPNGGRISIENPTLYGTITYSINGYSPAPGQVLTAVDQFGATGWSNPPPANVLAAGATINPADAMQLTNINPFEVGGVYTPKHFNLGKFPKLIERVRQNLPLRVGFFGDDSIHPEHALLGVLTSNVSQFYNGRGSILANNFVFGTYAYAVANGTYTDTPAGTTYPWPTTGLANGASMTNATASFAVGWDTQRIGIYYAAEDTFGTISVLTNAFGATPAVWTTINADNNGAFAWQKFEQDLPALHTNLVVSIYSSGTNLVLTGFEQWLTNAGSGQRFTTITGGNVGIHSYTSSASVSNLTRLVLGSLDVAVFTDIGGSSDITNGAFNLMSLMRANSVDCDIVLIPGTVQSNANPNVDNTGSYLSRAAYGDVVKQTPFVFVDTGAFFAPTNNKASLTGLYEDATHLNDTGDFVLGACVAEVLGWTPDYFGRLNPNYRRPRTEYATIYAKEFQNGSSGTTVTLTHLWDVGFGLYRCWAAYTPSGTANTVPWPAEIARNGNNRFYYRYIGIVTNANTVTMNSASFVYPHGTNWWNGVNNRYQNPTINPGAVVLGNSNQTNVFASGWFDISPRNFNQDIQFGRFDGYLAFEVTSATSPFYLIKLEFKSEFVPFRKIP
jgi:hypothetical protein